MESSQIIEQILEHVKRSDLETALSLLETHLKPHCDGKSGNSLEEHYNSVLFHTSRLSDLTRSIHHDAIGHDNANMQKAQITTAIIKIINDFKRHTQKDYYSQNSVRSWEEFKTIYEATLPHEIPCIEANIQDLNWNLIRSYISEVKHDLEIEIDNDKQKTLQDLSFFSPVPFANKVLHKSAVICFHTSPQDFYPQIETIFSLGNPGDSNFIKEYISGPIPEQFKKVVNLVLSNLNTISYIDLKNGGIRKEELEIDPALIREVISNAYCHRDYDSNDSIRISIRSEYFEIQNPGVIPGKRDWEDILLEDDNQSIIINPRIANYLRYLGLFEQLGRGFDVIRAYIKKHGIYSISHKRLPNDCTQIRIFRRPQKEATSIFSKAKEANPYKVLVASSNKGSVLEKVLLEVFNAGEVSVECNSVDFSDYSEKNIQWFLYTANIYDFAIFFFTQEDIKTFRIGPDQNANFISKNVLFQISTLMGTMGAERLFYIKPVGTELPFNIFLKSIVFEDFNSSNINPNTFNRITKRIKSLGVKKSAEKFNQGEEGLGFSDLMSHFSLKILNLNGDAWITRRSTIIAEKNNISSREHSIFSDTTASKYEDLQIQVKDSHDRVLATEKIYDAPSKKEFRVLFRNPLSIGERITYSYKFFWKGMFPPDASNFTISNKSRICTFDLIIPNDWDLLHIKATEKDISGASHENRGFLREEEALEEKGFIRYSFSLPKPAMTILQTRLTWLVKPDSNS